MTKQRGWTVGALVAVLVGVVAAIGVSGGWFGGSASSPGSDSIAGVIVRYDGHDYWVSDYGIAPSALGGDLATDVPFQDTTTDLRAIAGQDPSVTLAAYLPPLSTASPKAGWRLVSTDSGYWTDQANVQANAALLLSTP